MAQKQFGESNALQQHFSLFSIVCSEPNTIMWHFLNNVFAYYLLCMCSWYISLARVGLARAHPNNSYCFLVVYKQNEIRHAKDMHKTFTNFPELYGIL